MCTFPATTSRDCAHSRGFRRAPQGACDGSTPNVHTARNPVARYWGPATNEGPMCTLGSKPSQGCRALCDGIAPNVHIGAGSVAGSPDDRDGRAANAHIAAEPLVQPWVLCDESSSNVHIARNPVARLSGRRDRWSPNVHIGIESVAARRGPATELRGMCVPWRENRW